VKNEGKYIDTRCDGHVHTRLCHHAKGEMEEYVRSALACGLRELVFLEHMETGIDYLQTAWLTDEDFDYYFSEGERLQKKYGDRIRIGLGVELGYNREYREEIEKRLAKRQWDRIGISCHYLRYKPEEKHINLLSRNPANFPRARAAGITTILTDYLEHLTEAVALLPGTTLCHLDAALRHLPEVEYLPAHSAQIRTLLEAVKENSMCLEINTSGIPFRNMPFPAEPILALALKMNIPLTLGSDAHSPDEVGRHFDEIPGYINSVFQTLPSQATPH
jgi:histidinol-phosphatase (PHP family)